MKENGFYYHQLLSLMLLIFSVGVFLYFYNIPPIWFKNLYYYPFSCIVLTGNLRYTTTTDVYQLIAKESNTVEIFIDEDIGVIQKKIEQLPWIKQVSIRQQWPDVLKIHIIEYVPIVRWNDTQLISITGNIFSIPLEKYQNDDGSVPILYGPEGSNQAILMCYYICNKILESSINVQIKSINMDQRCSWKLVLQNNICLILGRKNIIERLCYFVKIYPILLHKIKETGSHIDYVDLRYTSGFALRWVGI